MRPQPKSSTADPALQAVVQRAMRQPLLSPEEEVTLAQAWRDRGDTRALQRLADTHLRLAVALTKRYRGFGLPAADLLQEGALGLMQAARRFDPTRGVRFSTYATWWVRAAMQDFVLRNWSIVRCGTTATQKTLFFNLRRLRAKIERETGRPLDEAGCVQIATELSVPTADVATMLQRFSAPDRSLQNGALEDDAPGLEDRLPDPAALPDERVGERDLERRRRAWLDEAMMRLNGRERTIVGERQLNESAPTLEALGERLGISKERVRQLEHRALSRLKATLESRGLGRDQLFA